MNSTLARAVAPALVLLLAAAPAAAQFACPAAQQAVGIGPAFLHDTGAGRALGAAGTVTWCRADYDPRPRLPRALYTGVQGDGAIPFTRLELPQNLRASAWAGVAWSLTERLRDPGGDLDDVGPVFGFDYGVLGLGGRVQYESATDFAEQAVAGGAELRWAHPGWRLAPALVLAVSAVRPLVSQVRADRGVDKAAHGRLGVQAYWLVPVGGPFELELDGRAFTGFGMDELVAEAGLDEGAFAAAHLVWVVRREAGPLRVDRVWGGYNHGRQPTDPHERRAWAIGVRLAGR